MAIEANSVNDISNRGATNATLAQFKGKPRQTIVNIDDGYRLVVMDGVTLGGKFKTASLDELNTAKADLQGKITTVSGVANSALTKTQADGYYLAVGGTAVKATGDAKGNNISTTYATKTELSTAQSSLQGAINGKAPTTHTHTSAQITDLSTTLQPYATTQTLNQKVSELTTSINGKAPVVHTHGTAQITGLDAALADKASNSALANYVAKTGNVGTFTAYTTVGTTTTINSSSPDANQTSSAVTVSNGESNTCWTKVVRLTASSPSVSLGSSWKWQGGSAPTLSQNGFLVLCWCGSGGLAVFNAVS